jgi:hypothetical protein
MTVTLLRQDFKRIIKKKEFKETFPEIKIEGYKIGCCSFPEDLYKLLVGSILSNTIKWKEFLKADFIKLYYSPSGSRKGYTI